MLDYKPKWTIPIAIAVTSIATLLILYSTVRDVLGALLVGVPPVLSILSIRYSLGDRPVAGRVVYFTSCFAFSVIVVGPVYNHNQALRSSIPREFLQYPYGAAFTVSLLFVVASGGLWIMRQVQERHAHSAATSFNMEFVHIALDKIETTFAEARSAISRETSSVDGAISQFKKLLEGQETRLQRLQQESKTARAEAEKYKALASLSKEQQAAVIESLRSGRRPDYLIGFALGFLGSAVVQIAAYMAENYIQ
ncbi:MAG: hypothetical protein GY720_16520 [bacterium]|nr:hypothetical protein [bacterium]